MHSDNLSSYVTKSELAAALQVTPRTITNYVEKKVIPAPTHFGRKALWPREEIAAFLAKAQAQ